MSRATRQFFDILVIGTFVVVLLVFGWRTYTGRALATGVRDVPRGDSRAEWLGRRLR